MSITFSMFTFVGSVLFVVSPSPSCPFPLYPHVHTVPSDFSTAKWFSPPTTFGCAIPPCTFTFTFMLPYTLFVSSEILICVVPIPTPVILFPLTVAILVSNDSYFKFIVTSLFNNVNFDSYLGLM